MYDRIIVPVDASASARLASRYGAMLARLLGGQLHLLHVRPQDPADFSDIPGNRTADTDADRLAGRETAREVLNAAREAAEHEAPGSIHEETIEDPSLAGDPASVIVESAGRETEPLVVIGSRGLDDLGKILFDSVSHKVLHRTNCPVAVVRADGAPSIPVSNIILAVDGSEHSERASDLAADVSRSADAPIQLLHVLPRRNHTQPDAEETEILARARARLGDLPAEVVEHRLTASHPAEAILVHASDSPAGTLIIMGRRGLGHLREHLVGGVSHRVVEGTPWPVILVN